MSSKLYLEERTDQNSNNTCFEGRSVPTLFCGISVPGGLPVDGISSGLSIKVSGVQPTVIPKNQCVLLKMLSPVLFLWKSTEFLIIFCIYYSDLHYSFFAKRNRLAEQWS